MRDLVPRTSREGSTLLAGIGSTGSEGVHMNLCIAWEDALPTFPGGLLESGQLSCQSFWLSINGPRILPEVSERPTALLTDSITVILSRFEAWKGKERGIRNSTARLAIPAGLRFLLARYWSHDIKSHDTVPKRD